MLVYFECFDVGFIVCLECFDPQEASYDYMEKEGERMFLECLDQLEVANAAEVLINILAKYYFVAPFIQAHSQVFNTEMQPGNVPGGETIAALINSCALD